MTIWIPWEQHFRKSKQDKGPDFETMLVVSGHHEPNVAIAVRQTRKNKVKGKRGGQHLRQGGPWATQDILIIF